MSRQERWGQPCRRRGHRWFSRTALPERCVTPLEMCRTTCSEIWWVFYITSKYKNAIDRIGTSGKRRMNQFNYSLRCYRCHAFLRPKIQVDFYRIWHLVEPTSPSNFIFHAKTRIYELSRERICSFIYSDPGTARWPIRESRSRSRRAREYFKRQKLKSALDSPRSLSTLKCKM